MELLSKLFDITKLPSKFFAWVVLLSACALFLPSNILVALQIEKFPADYKPFIGAAFLGASCFLLINCTIWVWSKAKLWFARRSLNVRIVSALTELDYSEKAVLREFFFQGKNVIELPVDRPTVAGLLQKGVLAPCGTTGFRSLAGSVFPCRMGSLARNLVTSYLVEYPDTPTESDIRDIHRSRPNFVHDIERNDRWRSGM